MMIGLTTKQKNLYLMIKDYYDDNGVMPRLTYLGERLGVTKQAVYIMMNTLVKKGVVRKKNGVFTVVKKRSQTDTYLKETKNILTKIWFEIRNEKE